MKINNKKGFTLIELLVVIAIIGLLSTLAVVSLNSARQKARDSRRMSDMKQISTAMEMIYTDTNSYPVAGTCGNASVIAENTNDVCSGDSLNAGGNNYLASLPADPGTGSAPYWYEGNTSSYCIAAELEVGDDNNDYFSCYSGNCRVEASACVDF